MRDSHSLRGLHNKRPKNPCPIKKNFTILGSLSPKKKKNGANMKRKKNNRTERNVRLKYTNKNKTQKPTKKFA